MATIKRTARQKVEIGEAILGLAMLGVHYLGGGRNRLEQVPLADYLARNPGAVPAWWNSRDPDEQLFMLQMIEMPRRYDYAVAANMRNMRPEAQDALCSRVSHRCRVLLDTLRRAGPAVVGDELDKIEGAAAMREQVRRGAPA